MIFFGGDCVLSGKERIQLNDEALDETVGCCSCCSGGSLKLSGVGRNFAHVMLLAFGCWSVRVTANDRWDDEICLNGDVPCSASRSFGVVGECDCPSRAS